MRRLKPTNKATYLKDGMQVFSKSGLGALLGIGRNIISRNIEAWEVQAVATDNKGSPLYTVKDYLNGQQRQSKTEEGEDKYGGYPDALEWKNAIAARRDELRLKKDLGELVNAFEAEAEIAACFADVAMMGETLLTHVDNILHPSGEDMESISRKFKQENSKYYERLLSDTEFID